MSFRERYLEEAKNVDPKELQKAAGYDYLYTQNPKETIFSLWNPIKADALTADDLETRAKTLGIDKNFLERNMAIRDQNSSGYVVDDTKLAGFASRMHPEHISFGNTVGSPKRLLPGMIISGLGAGLLGAAASGLGIDTDGDLSLQHPGVAIGAAGLGAASAPLANYIGFKQGQALYDRTKGKK